MYTGRLGDWAIRTLKIPCQCGGLMTQATIEGELVFLCGYPHSRFWKSKKVKQCNLAWRPLKYWDRKYQEFCIKMPTGEKLYCESDIEQFIKQNLIKWS